MAEPTGTARAGGPAASPARIRIRLADGKERTIQHMTATTFWSRRQAHVGGRVRQALFGELPELFKDEDELRHLWSDPDTRKALLEAWRRRATAASSCARSSA